MAEFLFVFGFESPDEWQINRTDGTDFESSEAVWIEAESEEAALTAGRAYAAKLVGNLFEHDPVPDWHRWSPSDYANWIEHEPLRMWSAEALQSVPRLKARDIP